MFVKERIAAMKKLEDAREKARIAELSRRGKAQTTSSSDDHPAGNVFYISSSDMHSNNTAFAILFIPCRGAADFEIGPC